MPTRSWVRAPAGISTRSGTGDWNSTARGARKPIRWPPARPSPSILREARAEKSPRAVAAKSTDDDPVVARVEPKREPDPDRPATDKPAGKARRPSAHILAVGISKYANSDFNLKYADRDAEEFTRAFAR